MALLWWLVEHMLSTGCTREAARGEGGQCGWAGSLLLPTVGVVWCRGHKRRSRGRTSVGWRDARDGQGRPVAVLTTERMRQCSSRATGRCRRQRYAAKHAPRGGRSDARVANRRGGSGLRAAAVQRRTTAARSIVVAPPAPSFPTVPSPRRTAVHAAHSSPDIHDRFFFILTSGDGAAASQRAAAARRRARQALLPPARGPALPRRTAAPTLPPCYSQGSAHAAALLLARPLENPTNSPTPGKNSEYQRTLTDSSARTAASASLSACVTGDASDLTSTGTGVRK